MHVYDRGYNNINNIVSELLSMAAPGPDPDADMPSEPSTPSEKPLLCDTGTQVVSERKNARVQITQRTKT